MEIEAVTGERLADVGELFESSATTRGCQCMWFLLNGKEAEAGWGDGNRLRFERLTREAGEPVGVLA